MKTAASTPIVVGRTVVLGLAVLFLAFGLRQAWTDSPTVDEGTDLASGLSHWVHHDLRTTPEHPPLPQLLAAAPALLADPIVPAGDAWERGDWFGQVDDVMAANDEAGRLRRTLFLSRLVPLAEVLACAALLWVLGRRLVGEGAGLLAAGAWLTTPVVLGLGHVQSIDVAFTLAVLVVVWTLARHRATPTVGRAVVVGAALAAALGTRHTALVLVPVALALVAAAPSTRAERIRQAVWAGGVGWIGLWLLYRGFDLTAPGGAVGTNFEGMIGAAGESSVLARAALLVPAPLEWRTGLAQLTLTSDPRPAYLFGQMWDGNRPWFFPGALVATVPVLVLVLLLVGPWGWRWADRARQVDALVVVAVPGLALFVFTAVQPLALGLRLALPPLALWMLLAACGARLGVAEIAPRLGPRQRLAGRVAIAVVVVVQVGVLVSAGAHALPWRPLAFRPAHRWVSDANLDFGQDLYRVRDWSEDHDDPWVSVVRPRGLDPGPGTRSLLDVEPSEVTGWVAVGATSLTVVNREALSWLRAYCPVGTVGGGSVLLYRFDEPPTAEPGPDRPVAPCPDGVEVSSRTG